MKSTLQSSVSGTISNLIYSISNSGKANIEQVTKYEEVDF